MEAQKLIVTVSVRRRNDTGNLRARLVEMMGDGCSASHSTQKRGGRIVITQEVDDAVQRMRDLAAGIRENRNLIDRIDQFTIVSAEGSKILGFAQDNWRGWMRETALEELAEVTL